MALVTQRLWRSGPRKLKRVAWGFTLQLEGRQLRCFREDWSKEDAEKALAERKLGLTPKAEPTPAAGITVGEMLDTYLAARRASPKNRSVKDDEERSRPLLAFFGAATPASEITRKRIGEYRLQRGATKSRRGRLLSPTTINRECQVLRGAMHYAHDDLEALGSVPKFKMAKEHPRDRWLCEDEIRRLLAACAESRNKTLLPIVTAALHTGLRLGEVTTLVWEKVDMARGIIVLGERTKSGKPRDVPMNQVVYNVLAPRRANAGGVDATGPVWRGASADIDTAFNAAVVRAGLGTDDPDEKVTFHTLRHTFGAHFTMKTGNLVKLQAILGHASIRTTQEVYSHFAPEYVQGSTAVLEGLGTGQTGAEINARSTHGSETVASADLSGVVGGA